MVSSKSEVQHRKLRICCWESVKVLMGEESPCAASQGCSTDTGPAPEGFPSCSCRNMQRTHSRQDVFSWRCVQWSSGAWRRMHPLRAVFLEDSVRTCFGVLQTVCAMDLREAEVHQLVILVQPALGRCYQDMVCCKYARIMPWLGKEWETRQGLCLEGRPHDQGEPDVKNAPQKLMETWSLAGRQSSDLGKSYDTEADK